MESKNNKNPKIIRMGKKVVPSTKPDSNEISKLKNLGAIIKYKRTTLGMSIQQTASLCNISDKTLRKLENGDEIKVSTLLNVVSMLGLRLTLEDK